MIDPAVLDAMLAAGCTAEQITAAVKADYAVQEQRKAAKRANNAERQRRHKAKVTSNNADNALPALPRVSNGHAPDKETSPTPPKEIKPPEPLVSPDGETAPAADEPELTVEHVMEAYNDLAARLGLPKAEKWTKARRRQAETRIRESTLDDWHRAFDAIERSAFLRGENERGWRAGFDFLLQPKSFTKLIEGAYDH